MRCRRSSPVDCDQLTSASRSANMLGINALQRGTGRYGRPTHRLKRSHRLDFRQYEMGCRESCGSPERSCSSAAGVLSESPADRVEAVHVKVSIVRQPMPSARSPCRPRRAVSRTLHVLDVATFKAPTVDMWFARASDVLRCKGFPQLRHYDLLSPDKAKHSHPSRAQRPVRAWRQDRGRRSLSRQNCAKSWAAEALTQASRRKPPDLGTLLGTGLCETGKNRCDRM
jgi:hypothetical protein